jgi:hypothetical protein
MKITIALSLVFLTCAISMAQVGVNTTDPTSSLDVNGTFRVRTLTASVTDPSTLMVGVDANGNLAEVQTGQNIALNNNVFAGNNTQTIDRSAPVVTAATINNLVALPSGPVTGFNMIRVRTTLPITFLTGIVAAPDGTTIVLYPTDGILTLLSLDIGSSSQNQIMPNVDLVIPQYQTAQLVYDADIQKWIKM